MGRLESWRRLSAGDYQPEVWTGPGRPRTPSPRPTSASQRQRVKQMAVPNLRGGNVPMPTGLGLGLLSGEVPRWPATKERRSGHQPTPLEEGWDIGRGATKRDASHPDGAQSIEAQLRAQDKLLRAEIKKAHTEIRHLTTALEVSESKMQRAEDAADALRAENARLKEEMAAMREAEAQAAMREAEAALAQMGLGLGGAKAAPEQAGLGGAEAADKMPHGASGESTPRGSSPRVYGGPADACCS